jgi:thiol-disulfide isomerase/thioredoxin
MVPARLMTLTVVVAASLLLAVVLRRRGGRARTVLGSAGLEAAELGRVLGLTATFVQFSTSTCAPCRSVHRVLAEFTADRPHVVHVELDAEQHLELVRRHRVFTTPTVLVLDGDGRVRQRLTGAVDRRGLHQALAALTLTPPSERPHV